MAGDTYGPRPKWVDAWREIWTDEPPEPGLEGAIQRVMTRLATGERQPGYGRFLQLNERGLRFFAELTVACGGTRPGGRYPWFCHEYPLPLPKDERRAGNEARWPDYGVMWHGQLLLVELKTDATRSVEQVNDQLRLARRKHPLERIHHLFVTVRRVTASPMLDERMAYLNMTWVDFASHIAKAFERERDAECLCSLIDRFLQ